MSESILPYSSASSKRFSLLPDSYAFNNSQAHIKNAYRINIKTNPELIKAEIKNHGAVGMAYDHLDSAENRPSQNGAWLVRNSWGKCSIYD